MQYRSALRCISLASYVRYACIDHRPGALRPKDDRRVVFGQSKAENSSPAQLRLSSASRRPKSLLRPSADRKVGLRPKRGRQGHSSVNNTLGHVVFEFAIKNVIVSKKNQLGVESEIRLLLCLAWLGLAWLGIRMDGGRVDLRVRSIIKKKKEGTVGCDIVRCPYPDCLELGRLGYQRQPAGIGAAEASASS